MEGAHEASVVVACSTFIGRTVLYFWGWGGKTALNRIRACICKQCADEDEDEDELAAEWRGVPSRWGCKTMLVPASADMPGSIDA